MIDLRTVRPLAAAVAAFAGIEIAIPWLLLGAAEQRLSSSLTGLLIASMPLIGTSSPWPPAAPTAWAGWRAGLLVGSSGCLAIVGGDFATRTS